MGIGWVDKNFQQEAFQIPFFFLLGEIFHFTDNKSPKPFPSILDWDIILQAHQQQSEIDRFLAHYVILHSFLLFHYQVCVFFF